MLKYHSLVASVSNLEAPIVGVSIEVTKKSSIDEGFNTTADLSKALGFNAAADPSKAYKNKPLPVNKGVYFNLTMPVSNEILVGDTG